MSQCCDLITVAWLSKKPAQGSGTNNPELKYERMLGTRVSCWSVGHAILWSVGFALSVMNSITSRNLQRNSELCLFVRCRAYVIMRMSKALCTELQHCLQLSNVPTRTFDARDMFQPPRLGLLCEVVGHGQSNLRQSPCTLAYMLHHVVILHMFEVQTLRGHGDGVMSVAADASVPVMPVMLKGAALAAI